MKIAIVDTYYPDFLKSMPFDANSTYGVELAKLLAKSFGTSDFYSRNLRALGHECIDLVVNHQPLQEMWARENSGIRAGSVLDAQRWAFTPDVVFLQDLSVQVKPSRLNSWVLAAQCSCPWPDDKNIQRCDVIFTSFPHYVKRFEELGVRGIYMPLAFEPRMLLREKIKLTPSGPTQREYVRGLVPDDPRDIDISFVGGCGRNSHWRQGTDVLEAVAAAFPTRFQWWGYGLDNLPASSALRACYRGEAFGRAMYSIYRRSKIVINRHGEVAQGYANNLRMYEATGCGALLLTEAAANLSDLFSEEECITYSGPEEAVEQIRFYLMDTPEREHLAANGQTRTLRNHTYAQRMKTVSEVLTQALNSEARQSVSSVR